jgi:hypothetical protein
MKPLAQAVTRANRNRSNFENKCRRAFNVINDPKLLQRAHKELMKSTQALFLEAYNFDDGEARFKLQEWQAQVSAHSRNKRVEFDEVASRWLPLQVKAHIVAELASR